LRAPHGWSAEIAPPPRSRQRFAAAGVHWFDWFDSVRERVLIGSIAGSRLVRLLVRGFDRRFASRTSSSTPPTPFLATYRHPWMAAAGNRTSANQREPPIEPPQNPCAARIEPIEPLTRSHTREEVVRSVRSRCHPSPRRRRSCWFQPLSAPGKAAPSRCSSMRTTDPLAPLLAAVFDAAPPELLSRLRPRLVGWPAGVIRRLRRSSRGCLLRPYLCRGIGRQGLSIRCRMIRVR
jgi:hypothetical protein